MNFKSSISCFDLDSWGRSGILVGSDHIHDRLHPYGTGTVLRHHIPPALSLGSHMSTLGTHIHTHTHFNVNISIVLSDRWTTQHSVEQCDAASVALRSQSDRFGSRTKKMTHQRNCFILSKIGQLALRTAQNPLLSYQTNKEWKTGDVFTVTSCLLTFFTKLWNRKKEARGTGCLFK